MDMERLLKGTPHPTEAVFCSIFWNIHSNIPIGVTVSFRDMNKVLEIHQKDMDAVVQPGVTYDELNDALRPLYLFFSVDP